MNQKERARKGELSFAHTRKRDVLERERFSSPHTRDKIGGIEENSEKEFLCVRKSEEARGRRKGEREERERHGEEKREGEA